MEQGVRKLHIKISQTYKPGDGLIPVKEKV